MVNSEYDINNSSVQYKKLSYIKWGRRINPENMDILQNRNI